MCEVRLLNTHTHMQLFNNQWNWSKEIYEDYHSNLSNNALLDAQLSV